ncbi:hypothetical protein Gotri_014723 [Gossypium trilobum]|uniref:RNase H type-1 domain-containing protein n=1 Tax=Gossypium trilobum TaxID=34281 RepID=A0A7J9DYF3_9ROSI|nr:hypothetical protein [Gossypium trilobum]
MVEKRETRKQRKRGMRRLEDREKGVATSGKRRKMRGKRNLVLNLLYVPMLPRRLRVEHWEAPFGEMLKINVDVAWIARKRMATHEAVVHDSKGMICAGCTQYLEGAFATLSTKTIVIIGVLQIARDLDLHHIEVELGCLAIVNKLNCNSLDLSFCGHFIEAHRFCNWFDYVDFHFVH